MRAEVFHAASLLLLLLTAGCAGQAGPVSASGHDWRELQTEHVVLRTDLRARPARRAIVLLERQVQLLRDNTFPCAQKLFRRQLQVTLFRHNANYRTVAPTGADAAYAPAEPGLAKRQPQVLMHGRVTPQALWVFQHELTHHLVRLCHASAPVWLHEGLAQYLETAVYQDGSLVVGIPRMLAWHQPRMGDGAYHGVPLTLVPAPWLPRPSQLVRMQADSFYAVDQDDEQQFSRQRVVHYAAAALLVHMLESAEGKLAQAYQRYLHALATGTPDTAAFERAFRNLDLDAAFERALDAKSVPTFSIRTALPAPPPPSERQLSAAQTHAHLAALGNWQKPKDRERAAQQLALGLAAAPTNTTLRLMRIDLLLASDDAESAQRALVDWLAQAPDDPDALRAQLALAVANPDGAGKRCTQAAQALAQQRSLGDDAHDLDLAARCALQSRKPSLAAQYVGRALARDPLCARCHLTRALVHAERGAYDEAEACAVRAAQLAGEDSEWAWQAAAQLREQLSEIREERLAQE